MAVLDLISRYSLWVLVAIKDDNIKSIYSIEKPSATVPGVKWKEFWKIYTKLQKYGVKQGCYSMGKIDICIDTEYTTGTGEI